MKTLFIVAMFIFSVSSFANQGGNAPEKRTPPESAISACEGKADQTVCSMNGHRGEEVAGVCENTPDNKYFACKPNQMGEERRPRKQQ